MFQKFSNFFQDFIKFFCNVFLHSFYTPNMYNYGMWSTTNPRVDWEASIHLLKVGAWWAIYHRWIVGPIFFDSMITTETYRWIIPEFVILLECSEVNVWFQHDNAHPLPPGKPCNFFNHIFCWFAASLQSTDLFSLDFDLWGHFKNKVFRTALPPWMN